LFSCRGDISTFSSSQKGPIPLYWGFETCYGYFDDFTLVLLLPLPRLLRLSSANLKSKPNGLPSKPPITLVDTNTCFTLGGRLKLGYFNFQRSLHQFSVSPDDLSHFLGRCGCSPPLPRPTFRRAGPFQANEVSLASDHRPNESCVTLCRPLPCINSIFSPP